MGVSSTSSSVVEQKNDKELINHDEDRNQFHHHHHHHHHHHYHNHHYSYQNDIVNQDSEERLAATTSTTKDSIEEEKNITPAEKAFHINQISPIHSTLLTPRHDDIARTSSNISDYHFDTKEIELAADPYNSGTTNVSCSSRNYQQYCASEILNISHRNLSNNED